ncbi:hypothetical protein [Curvibacter gracilis]|uniref:hypothetical protein n=1 Tax=Curvibacter gracilis TaxID=230310 RepID=UPI000481E980|nr:hypothetical protein [Curvibacter gracilis]
MTFLSPGAKALCLLLGVGLLSACGNKLSLENYNRIKVGQSYEEVRQIVGDPAHCDETLGVRTCQWGDSSRGIRVNFAVDKVVLMSAENLK